MRIRVVAAAIFRDGKLFAARRSQGVLAGLWEFPGGKVERGESDEQALVREISEELGMEIKVGEKLGEFPFDGGGRLFVLVVFRANSEASKPSHLSDHDAYRWLAAGELDSVKWAAADVPAIEMLKTVW